MHQIKIQGLFLYLAITFLISGSLAKNPHIAVLTTNYVAHTDQIYLNYLMVNIYKPLLKQYYKEDSKIGMVLAMYTKLFSETF